MGRYTTRQVATLAKMPRSRLLALVRAGVLNPGRGPRGELQFGFDDVAFLRSLGGLAKCSPRRLRAAVRNLARDYPGRSLARFRIEVEGREVVARDERGVFDPASGQAFLPFGGGADQGCQGADVVRVRRPADSEAWFCHGSRLEATAADEAAAAYERALDLDPDHAAASVNLGRLRHLAGDTDAAVALYRRALRHDPDEPIALFNLGVALEDLGRDAEALGYYEQAVRLVAMPDAHYNAARLCERRGDHLGAVRHFKRYRALTGG